MRDVPEWIGRDDNQAIPPRVKIRVHDRAGGVCKICTRQTDEKLRPAIDHKISIVNHGPNRESNLQLLCVPCHEIKTKADVAEKAMVARKHAKDIGMMSPRRQKILSRGFSKAEPQRTASRPIVRQSR